MHIRGHLISNKVKHVLRKNKNFIKFRTKYLLLSCRMPFSVKL